MTGKQLTIIAAAGSAALLLGAFAFQYIWGYAPCKMCLWQRWPHGAAILFGIGAVTALPLLMTALGALAALTTAGIGTYHAGVEYGWWPGPDSCTGSGDGLGGLSGGDLLSMDGAAPIVMCDQVVWSFLGVSMAGWNAIISFALVLIWIQAFRRFNEG